MLECLERHDSLSCLNSDVGSLLTWRAGPAAAPVNAFEVLESCQSHKHELAIARAERRGG